MIKKTILTVLAASLAVSSASCGNNAQEKTSDVSISNDTTGIVSEDPNTERPETNDLESVNNNNISKSGDESSVFSVSSEESSSTESSFEDQKSEVSLKNEESSSDIVVRVSEPSVIKPAQESSSAPEPSVYEHSAAETSVPEHSAAEHSFTEQSVPQNSNVSMTEESSSAVSVPNESSRSQSSIAETEVSEENSRSEESSIYVGEAVNVQAPETVGFMLHRVENGNDNVVSVRLEKGEDVDGYIIEYSLDPHFRKSNTQSVITRKQVKPVRSLEFGKKYYFRVRTFRDAGKEKVCSPWSQSKVISLKKMVVVNGVTYIDGIIIANKTYSLPRNFGSGLANETQDAFIKMQADAAAEGIYLWIVSGFRSYDTQKSTYNFFLNDRGQELADLCSARPGHSEHQTGLALDVNTVSDAFVGTKEAIWLGQHCAEYGFIIRYPKGKESITGYKYEPWHIRYVGSKKALEITESGLTVEEYYGISSFYH